jgi:hypothetical protein
LDLGTERAVGRVELDLVGKGTGLQVRAADTRGTDPTAYRTVAEEQDAGTSGTLKIKSPMPSRYLLVWLTDLPKVEGGWRGGVREIRVFG